MKITVLGATGGVGGEVVKQALDRGWDVTAVVRDPAKLQLPAQVVVAGFPDHDKLAAAVEGRDAVISALGSRDRGPTTVCVDGARAAIGAGAKRLLVVSASGMHTEGDGFFTRSLVKPLLNTFLKHGWADMLAMEAVVKPVTWTGRSSARRCCSTARARARSRAGSTATSARSPSGAPTSPRTCSTPWRTPR